MPVAGGTVRKADHPIDDAFRRSLVAARDVGRADLAGGARSCCSRPRGGRPRPATHIPGASSTRTATRNTGRCSSTCSSSATRSGAATQRRCCCSSRERRTSRPAGRSVTHSYDTGAAWENLALQGTLRGLVVHGMAGFDYARARTTLEHPGRLHVEAMAAVGKPGPRTICPRTFRRVNRRTRGSRWPSWCVKDGIGPADAGHYTGAFPCVVCSSVQQ